MAVVHYPRSFCSQGMEKLLTWRNPHGDEINWYHGNKEDDDNRISYNSKEFLIRKITTELTLPILAVASLIESIAWLALGFLIIYSPFSLSCTNKMWHYADSAAFTMGWTIACLFNNFIYTNLSTKEAFASIHFTGGGKADSDYRKAWISEQRVPKGANLILNEVVKPNIEDTDFMNAFNDYENELYPYVLVKSFALAVTEQNHTGLFKLLFKDETFKELEKIKKKYEDDSIEQQSFLDAVKTWKNFKAADKGIKDNQKTLLFEVYNLHAPELRNRSNGFLFIADAWKEALKSPLFLQT